MRVVNLIALGYSWPLLEECCVVDFWTCIIIDAS